MYRWHQFVLNLLVAVSKMFRGVIIQSYSPYLTVDLSKNNICIQIEGCTHCFKLKRGRLRAQKMGTIIFNHPFKCPKKIDVSEKVRQYEARYTYASSNGFVGHKSLISQVTIKPLVLLKRPSMWL